MKPIPVPDLSNGNEPLATILFVTGMLVVIFGLFQMFTEDSHSKKRGKVSVAAYGTVAVIGTALTVVGVLLNILGNQGISDRDAAKTASVQSAISDSYGISLSPDQVKDLRYPSKAPEESFRIYGSTVQPTEVRGGSFTKQTVYLVWVDGKLQLSTSADGKHFEELKSRT